MKTNSQGERPDVLIKENNNINLSSLDRSVVTRYIFSTFFLNGQKSVLDVGCGYGHGVLLQSFFANQVTGNDVSIEALEIAEKSIDSQKINNVTFEKNFENLQKYDLVTAFEIIEHIDKKDGIELIEEIKKHLKNEGIFIISTPYIDLRGKTYWKFHKHEYFGSELKKILQKNFNNVKTFYQFGNGTNIENNFLLSLSKNPLTSESSIIFVCSDFQISKNNYKLDHSNFYLLARGLYRNLKYLIK